MLRKITTHALLITLILSPNQILSASSFSDEKQAVKKTVEKFCLAEFEGDILERREDVVKLSKRETKIRLEKHPEKQPLAYYDLGDKLYLITSYTVLESSISIKGKTAEAYVDYRRVGTRRNEGFKVEPDKKEHDIVKLNLVYENNRWRVLDPPLPRVSKQVLINRFEQELSLYNERWLKKASKVQIESRDKLSEALIILKTKIEN